MKFLYQVTLEYTCTVDNSRPKQIFLTPAASYEEAIQKCRKEIIDNWYADNASVVVEEVKHIEGRFVE